MILRWQVRAIIKNMRVAYFILFIFFVPFNAYPSKERLLVCLGREELALHQAKNVGPQYYLNRLFVNELAQRPDLSIKSEYVKEICEDKTFSPSLAFLRALLLRENKIFFGRRTTSSKQELVRYARKVFFDYMLRIQFLIDTPDCLTKYIPEYAYFLERYKYLEEDYSEQIFAKAQIQEVFNKLQNLDTILNKCSKDKKHQQTNPAEKVQEKSGR